MGGGEKHIYVLCVSGKGKGDKAQKIKRDACVVSKKGVLGGEQEIGSPITDGEENAMVKAI